MNLISKRKIYYFLSKLIQVKFILNLLLFLQNKPPFTSLDYTLQRITLIFIKAPSTVFCDFTGIKAKFPMRSICSHHEAKNILFKNLQ